ncbi:ABC transporter ATP-binding protein [Oceanithermus sp.]|uniref:ABC transporter ATP-binding protein n=1 Tax=Oceanithermus profundus TaxID=187137 RepID=A0A7C5ST92_9DEIN|nr:ABC transporter ATP-binding protein [Oceanithermus sp.]HHO58301.1 ABC transporter ATP-binding protein [Oceanithermus profundus]
MHLELERVTRRFGGTVAVDGLSLELPTGGVVGLLGTNGAGKSTTLKLMAGLLYPDAGEVRLDGAPPRRVRGAIAFLPERGQMYEWLDVRGAVGLFGSLYPDFRPERFYELLDQLEVPRRSLTQLSKGQRARFLLAATLARKVRLYLLDEPLGGVDLITRDRILAALVSEWREDATYVLSTHEVAEAEGIFDRAVFMKEGRVVLNASAEELRERGQSVAQAFREVLA